MKRLNPPPKNNQNSSLISPLAIARMIGVSIVYLGHLGLITDQYFRGSKKSGWFWFFPLAAPDGGTLVVFFFCLTSYLLTNRYFLSHSKYWLLLGSLKRWPQLALPTILSLWLAVALNKLSLYHCTHWFPQNASFVHAAISGIIAPVYAHKAAAYVFPMWFITGIFYMSHLAVVIALIFSLLLRENIKMTIILLVVLFTGLHFLPENKHSAIQSLHIPEMLTASISVVIGVLLSWWHGVKKPKIENVVTASILLAVSLICLFFLFFVQIYRELAGHQSLEIPFHFKIYIQTFATAGIIHSTVCNREINDCATGYHYLILWSNRLSLIIFFIHSQVIQTVGCWLLKTYLTLPQANYWTLLGIFYATTIVLMISSLLVYYFCTLTLKLASHFIQRKWKN